MKRILLPFVALAALVLPSCLQQHTTITLNQDGSGTIVEETVFGAQMSAMLGGLGGLGGGEDAKDPLKDLMSPDKAKARAAKLGEGVTVEKTEAIDADGKKGARVTYHFADINKVKFTDSTDAMGEALGDGMPAPAGADKPKADKKPTTFKYVDNVLTITNPDDEKVAKEDKEEAAEEGGDDPQAAQMEAMMKGMMADMKISLKLVIPAGIAETNATHVDGNTITLAEMDMGKIMETPGAFKKLQGAGQDSEKAMAALKDVKGVKMEAKKAITVKVK
ncbi:MAG: hypothetical protein K9N23_13130 [Akkermansiaceae bacterium]|nr:hypothetical protein [Akkermansiaceae bacterium]MCF7732627.1 hypothetical protein [Akkermansiaceae bacterium]